jgi:hypothetical protein
VLTQPIQKIQKFGSVQPAGGQMHHDAFLIIDVGIDLGAVQNEERLHGGMADALVPVDEGVVLDQGEAKGGRILSQRRVQVGPVERRPGQSQGRFQRSEIANPSRTARGLEESPVKLRSSTTSPSVRYRIRPDGGTTPRSSSGLARRPA